MASKDQQGGQASEFSAWDVEKEKITTWGGTTTVAKQNSGTSHPLPPTESSDANIMVYQLPAAEPKSSPFPAITSAYNHAPPTIQVQQQQESFAHKTSVQDNGGGSREQYLQEWERDLKAREEKAGTTQKEAAKQKRNFPRCFPLVHHDIANDIPSAKQGIVKLGFFTWMATAIVLLYNWISVCLALGQSAGKIGAFFLALIYVVLGIPGAWLLWYGRLYRGAMSDGALNYCTFFCTFMLHFLFCIYCLIAPGLFAPKFTTTGVLATISAFDEATIVGIFYLVGTILWGLLTLWSFFFLIRVYRSFRNQEQSGAAASSSNKYSRNRSNGGQI